MFMGTKGEVHDRISEVGWFEISFDRNEGLRHELDRVIQIFLLMFIIYAKLLYLFTENLKVW